MSGVAFREGHVIRACTAIVTVAMPLTAQRPPPGVFSRYDHAQFVETVHSDVVTQSGSAERHRSIDRATTYSMQHRGDTLVVTIDTMALRENDEGQVRDIDVDPVIGARWKLLRVGGRDTVIDRPFVPEPIAEVSDVGVAMDDFFPGATLGRTWQPLADSAGIDRTRWSYRGRIDSTSALRDSSAAPVSGSVRDDGQLAWSAGRGDVAWTREVDTDFDSRVGGRAVRGTVRQHIVVHRVQ